MREAEALLAAYAALEPQANALENASDNGGISWETHTSLSIAISLKRIADLLEQRLEA
jgi:hypothetical protein